MVINDYAVGGEDEKMAVFGFFVVFKLPAGPSPLYRKNAGPAGAGIFADAVGAAGRQQLMIDGHVDLPQKYVLLPFFLTTDISIFMPHTPHHPTRRFNLGLDLKKHSFLWYFSSGVFLSYW